MLYRRDRQPVEGLQAIEWANPSEGFRVLSHVQWPALVLVILTRAASIMTRLSPPPARPIRVAHVVLQLQTGGMEKLLVEFARHADRGRFDLHFVSLGGRGPVADEIEACGWSVNALHEPPGLRLGLVRRLGRLLAALKVQVVHTHNTKPLLYSAPAAWLAGARALVHTRHGQRFGAGRAETRLFRLASTCADAIVSVSEDASRLSRAEGLKPGKLRIIWNGIDVTRFAYAGPSPRGPVVMVGRLSPEKDVATLVRAFAVAARSEPELRLEIAGDGACRVDLERLTAELGLTGVVRFLGEVRDVPALLGRASLMVLPSLTEGISLTLLEAMARGLPVVATRVGGNPEVARDGETGLLVPPGDPEALAGAIARMHRDPDLARRMGEAGRLRVERHFDVRRMVADYEALYLGILAKNGRRRPAPGLAMCG